MPNWCDNRLTLRGEPTKMAELQKAMLDNRFFNTVIPVPEELTDPRTTTYGGDDVDANNKLRGEMIAKYGYDSWYMFCVDNWGTKWDAHIEEAELTDDGGVAVIDTYFDTAWSPPLPVYKELTRQGFVVKAYYHELGEGFCGSYKSGEGEEYFNIKENSADWVCANIPDDINDAFDMSNNYSEMETNQ
jgi:hypothetical protein